MRRRVLVVEDDVQTAELLRLILKQAKFDVTTLFHGVDAIKYLGYEEPDIILLDVSIPGYDGFEILHWLRQKLGDVKTPVIMLSGHASLQTESLADALGANDYLVKPFDYHELTKRMDALMLPLVPQVQKNHLTQTT